ncbi:hypothetical protein SAMN05720764_1416 [Fibrobacter sp. UWH5]|uniref:hypothetical protein n=1 Tax=Fibrobacter sp. UWH5 TaxID=1896211 RepID=UPI00091CEF16|nr:hypothetical protein [Fibrobacter sp. UWH5]SHL92970.1 hypothetical protein SAMN05720764_1416 [Fibrobacter sp. UWH5]
MNLDAAVIPSYYSRLVMAKNQGHFKIAQALLELIVGSSVDDSTSAVGRKALEKIAQAKGHAATIAAGTESVAEIPAGEAADWQEYALQTPPYTRKLALALATYFVRANLLETAYEMYLSAGELDEDGSSAEDLSAIAAAESGNMANDFGKKCEEAGNHAKAAGWYKKAKDAGLADADAALARMQSFHGVTRFIAPWLEIAKKTGRKELAEAIVAIAANAKAGNMDAVTISESVVLPCYQELDFWESELDAYFKFSGDDSEAYGNAIAAIGKILERAKMYNVALRWFKKAGAYSKAANDDARRMLPLKSKSITMREADDIYDSTSPIPSLWKI